MPSPYNYGKTITIRVPKQLKDFTLQSFSMAPSEKLLKKLGYFLGKYNKYRQEVILRGTVEGEHYNFWLNECSYECVIVLIVLLQFFQQFDLF